MNGPNEFEPYETIAKPSITSLVHESRVEYAF